MGMSEARPDYLILREFIRRKMEVKALLEVSSSQEVCAAVESALADLGRTAVELRAQVPASYDRILEVMMLSDEVAVTEILAAMTDLSDEVLSAMAAKLADFQPIPTQ
jgi:hypothetical protein